MTRISRKVRAARATGGEELDHKEKLKTKWAALEAVGGEENRIG